MSEAVLFTFSIFGMIFISKYLFEFIDKNRKKYNKKITVILINIGFIMSGLMTNLLMILFFNDYRYGNEMLMPFMEQELEMIKTLNTLMSKMLVPNFIMIILIVIFIIVTDKKEE